MKWLPVLAVLTVAAIAWHQLDDPRDSNDRAPETAAQRGARAVGASDTREPPNAPGETDLSEDDIRWEENYGVRGRVSGERKRTIVVEAGQTIDVAFER